MKRNLCSLMLCLCAVFAFNTNSNAQSTLIHYWHFNNFTATYNLPSIPGIAADFSIHDTAKAKILFEKVPGTVLDSSYLDPYTPAAAGAEPDFDTVNARMGAASGNALRTRNPTDSMQLLFYIPTDHYKNIVLKYGCERSNNGMLQQMFDYSTDSGSTWKTSALSVPSATLTDTFSLITVSFTTDTLVNNNSKLVFRLTFMGNTVSNSGNNRFDNVTVEGDSIIAAVVPPTAVQGVTAAAFTVYPNPVSNDLQINATLAGEKSVTVYNAIGQNVYTATQSGTHFSVNVSSLPAGVYYMNVRENSTGEATRVKFVKN